MKPILVHVHVYYPNLYEELKQCIKNIEPHPFDLFVTMVEEHSGIIDDIKTTFSEAKIQIVENRGYDVGPFIEVINQVNLDNYDYIIKLHTKRNIVPNKHVFRNMYDSIWRDELLSFIKSRNVFNLCLQAFKNNSKIGMLASHKVIVHNDFYDTLAHNACNKFIKDKKFPVIKFAFVAGTMFIARASIFSDIQKLHLSLADFPPFFNNHQSQFAHVMERFLGYVVYKNNMVLKDGLLSDKEEAKYHKNIYRKRIFDKIVGFFFQKKITKHRKKIIKICKIPVYYKSKKERKKERNNLKDIYWEDIHMLSRGFVNFHLKLHMALLSQLHITYV